MTPSLSIRLTSSRMATRLVRIPGGNPHLYPRRRSDVMVDDPRPARELREHVLVFYLFYLMKGNNLISKHHSTFNISDMEVIHRLLQPYGTVRDCHITKDLGHNQ